MTLQCHDSLAPWLSSAIIQDAAFVGNNVIGKDGLILNAKMFFLQRGVELDPRFWIKL